MQDLSFPLPFKQFVSQGYPEGSLRWMIFNEKYNGLAESGAIIRVGSRIYIDSQKFLNWLRTNPKISPPRPKSSRAKGGRQ